jgi:hypothetical protein
MSILNYARLVGFFSGISLHKFTFYPDKAAAHFGITAPRRDRRDAALPDNPALLDLSVIYPVSYSFDRFRVGIFKLRRTDSVGDLHTGTFPTWSLTETHEALQARYKWESNL